MISDHKDQIVANNLKPSQIMREEFESNGNRGDIIVRYRFTSDYFIRTKIVREIENFQFKLVGAGADSIYLMDLFSSKLNQHKEETRNNAIDDAKQTMNSVAKKMGWKNIRVVKIDTKECLPKYQPEQNSSGCFGMRSIAGGVSENNGGTNDSQFDNIKGMQYADAYVNISFSYETD